MSHRIEPDNSLRFEVAARPNATGGNDIETLPGEGFPSPSAGVMEKIHAQEISRILKVMKVLGIYYGQTNLVDFPSSSCRPHVLGKLYSCFAVFTLWITLFAHLVSLAYAVDSYTVTHIFMGILTCCWVLICAGNAMICVFVLPIGRRKPSRFERFLTRLASKTAENPNENRHGRSKKAFWFVIIVLLVNQCFTFSDSMIQDRTRFSFEPWDRLSSSIGLISRISVALFGHVSILLPIYLFSTVCSILSDECESLKKELESFINSGTLQLKAFRRNHEQLLTAVEFADKTFSSMVLLDLTCYIPLIVFFDHRLATFPSPVKDNMIELMTLVYYGSASLAVLTILLWNGTRVNEKIHGFSKILQQSSFDPADTKESCELLRVLLHLQGEPLGLTVGGLAVITKSFSLTVFGALISYFTVLLSLPQTSS